MKGGLSTKKKEVENRQICVKHKTKEESKKKKIVNKRKERKIKRKRIKKEGGLFDSKKGCQSLRIF